MNIKRNYKLRVLYTAGVAAITLVPACRRNSEAPPASPKVVKGADAEGPVSREDLYATWANARFRKLSPSSIAEMLRRHMSVDNGADVSDEALRSLKTTLADMLTAYATNDFDKYLAFRDPKTLVGADDPIVAKRLEALRGSWNGAWGDPPADVRDLLHFTWRMYVQGELTGGHADPVIDRVDWASCHTHIGYLPQGQVDPTEWDQRSDSVSHFTRSLKSGTWAAVLPAEIKPVVPNRVSAVHIAQRDGQLVYADFQIVQTTAKLPPHPLIVRFVYDPKADAWYMYNAVKIENNPPHVFVW